MKNVLIVVDMQKDFVDGALGTKEAVSIVPAVCHEIENENYDAIVVTMDTHEENYMDTREGRYLPVEHCIRNTAGWQIDSDVAAALEKRKDIVTVIEKPTFGSQQLVHLLYKEQPEKITLCGLCTDICVISNALALKAALYETDMAVIEHCCAGVTPLKHDSAIEVMRSCQIDIL